MRKAEIIKLYKQGYSINLLIIKSGKSKSAIKNILENKNIKIRPAKESSKKSFKVVF